MLPHKTQQDKLVSLNQMHYNGSYSGSWHKNKAIITHKKRSPSILREVGCVYFTRSSNPRHFSSWTWQSIYWPKHCTPATEAQSSWPFSQQPTVVSRPWHNPVLATKFPTRTAGLANLILVDFVTLAGGGSTCPLWSSPLRYFVHPAPPPPHFQNNTHFPHPHI